MLFQGRNVIFHFARVQHSNMFGSELGRKDSLSVQMTETNNSYLITVIQRKRWSLSLDQHLDCPVQTNHLDLMVQRVAELHVHHPRASLCSSAACSALGEGIELSDGGR